VSQMAKKAQHQKNSKSSALAQQLTGLRKVPSSKQAGKKSPGPPTKLSSGVVSKIESSNQRSPRQLSKNMQPVAQKGSSHTSNFSQGSSRVLPSKKGSQDVLRSIGSASSFARNQLPLDHALHKQTSHDSFHNHLKDKGSGASTARVTYTYKNPRIMRESLQNYPDEPMRTSDLRPSEEEKARPTQL